MFVFLLKVCGIIF